MPTTMRPLTSCTNCRTVARDTLGKGVDAPVFLAGDSTGDGTPFGRSVCNLSRAATM
jgi:hypothetical protein